jgi:glucokinase
MSSDPTRVVDLVADIGGTNARFALVDDRMRPFSDATLRCDDHAGLVEAVQAYLADVGSVRLRSAAFALATAITGDRIQFTNSRWNFSTEASRQSLGLERLVLLNDFTALAYSLPLLDAEDLRQVGAGSATRDAAMGVLGPGTGLGMSGLIPAHGGWVPLQGEGGHCTFSPGDAHEAALLALVWRDFPHVSAERMVSGIGMETLYRAVLELEGQPFVPATPAEITQRALAEGDAVCLSVLDTFCAMLGTVAGNLALTIGARGGVYIGGGIVPRLGDFFDRSRFRERFEAKGRFASYLATIPTFVICANAPALTGAACALKQL